MDQDERDGLYTDCLNEIFLLGPGGRSVSSILSKLSNIDEDDKFKDAILAEMKKSGVYPETLIKILIFLRYVQMERTSVNGLYEKGMEIYEDVNKIISKGKPTDDENRLKKILTDFILKTESLFENNDRADEEIIKEMNKFMLESNLQGGVGKPFLNTRVSSRTSMQIKLVIERLLDTYFEYQATKRILDRLVRISGFIIEDAEKNANRG